MNSSQVVDIELDRETELRVTYADDVTATFPLASLRRSCPCAGCRGQREQSIDPLVGDTVTALEAELHGNWGMTIRWSDGHDTGIYAWEHLRRWWDAHRD